MKMTHNNETLSMLSDDGNGNRLWQNAKGKVANEKYDPETRESFGLDDGIDGWGYEESESLL